jgi:hypothetical protein
MLRFDVSADPDLSLPATVPRLLSLSAGNNTTVLIVPVAQRWVRVTIAHRRLPNGQVSPRFNAVSNAPMSLRKIRAVAAPDVMYRVFENGAVFANPSEQAVELDVATLLPDLHFRRLRGSADQDPATNDGTPLGSTLTLPALDALIAVRT